MEYSLAGVKKTGTWEEVVTHGAVISEVLREQGVSGEQFEEWEHWRPKVHEALQDELNVKTADQTAIKKGPGEKRERTGKGDIVRAGKRLADSPVKAKEDVTQASRELNRAFKYLRRAFDTLSRKFMRRFERPVYKHVMTQVSPCYFNNELISAYIDKKTNPLSERHVFVFEVGFNDDEFREEMVSALKDYEEEKS